MSAIENEAKVLTQSLGDGVQQDNMQPLLDQLNKDKSEMSPKDYATLLNDVNKSAQKLLPGVELTDTAATGPVALQAQDKYGMSEQVTGDAAGAANLQKAAADAKMPNAQNFVSSELATAIPAGTDSNGNQTWNTADGGSITAVNQGNTTEYYGVGDKTSDNWQAAFGSPDSSAGSSVQLGDGSGYDDHGNYDVIYGKSMGDATAVISKGADGVISDQKVSHVKQDLEKVGLVAAGVAVAAAGEVGDYRVLSNPYNGIADKVIGTAIINQSAGDAIQQLSEVQVAPPTVPIPPQYQ
jgi:hypothetical protein